MRIELNPLDLNVSTMQRWVLGSSFWAAWLLATRQVLFQTQPLFSSLLAPNRTYFEGMQQGTWIRRDYLR
jgi:hypothetical protein